ncbi:hypothetical protein Ancab_033329 [Ancistrocladus abbreviatus]
MEFSSTSLPSSSQYRGLIPVTSPRWEGGLIYESQQQQQLMFKNDHNHINSTDAPLEASSISGTSSNFYQHHPDRHHGATVELMEAISPEPQASENTISRDQDEGGDSEGRGGAAGSSGSLGAIAMETEREHMFDKVVTPSDVGKLNRLVIPKQHAEKYFPLDSSTDKGLLLNFEDRGGKSWRFRYSYWNSSQSYVMTKGWSRFVKEKKLDAGDIVSFQRGVGELTKDKFYIDWRRRPDVSHPVPLPLALPPTEPPFLPRHHHHHHHNFNFNLSLHHLSPNWSSTPLLLRPVSPTHLLAPSMAMRDHGHATGHIIGMIPPQYPNPNYEHNHNHHRHITTGYGMSAVAAAYGYGNQQNNHRHLQQQACLSGSSSLIYLQRSGAPQVQSRGQAQVEESLADGVGAEPMVFESIPVVQGKGKGKGKAAKRLRLFGVNMDCPNSQQADDCDILSYTTNTPMMPLSMNMDVNLESRGQFSSSNSSSSHPNDPPFHGQLKLHNGTPVPALLTDFLADEKGKSSSTSISLDLDI